MDGRTLRLALASIYAGSSTALGARLRPYSSIEAAWDDWSRWCLNESPKRQDALRQLAHDGDFSSSWLTQKDSDQWQLVALGDAAYPPLLAELPDPPGVLFVRGAVETLQQPQLAMVGSRGASAEGRGNARHLATALAHNGFVITSGLAAGIDKAAHEGTLGVGQSIAVMGTGPDRIYPARHRALADQLVAEGGALVTEFPPGSQAKPFHFPMRNRIVSGMSLGVIVVEAALKSGSLITARLAMEQGRDVFALPGSIRNPLSRGCHQLLRDGANWLEETSDVLSVFDGMKALAAGVDQQGKLFDDQPELVNHFYTGINTLDSLQKRTGLLLTDLMEQLADLELEGWVEKAPGGYQLAG